MSKIKVVPPTMKMMRVGRFWRYTMKEIDRLKWIRYLMNELLTQSL